jgi:hypothetical protein
MSRKTNLLDDFKKMRDDTEGRLLHLQRQREGLERSISHAAAKLEVCEEMLFIAESSRLSPKREKQERHQEKGIKIL